MTVARRVLLALLAVFLVFFLSSCVDKGRKTGHGPELTIACLGDSITHGFKLGDPQHESYPARLEKMSQGRWQVINCGHDGATVIRTGDIPVSQQEEYRKVVETHPDMVVVMLGTNDTKNVNWQHIEDFVKDYTALIRSLRELPSTPQVFVCSIPPVFNDHPNGVTAWREEKINTLIDKVVQQTGVEFIDIYGLLKDQPALFVDGVHPNAAGAEKIAREVHGFIVDR